MYHLFSCRTPIIPFGNSIIKNTSLIIEPVLEYLKENIINNINRCNIERFIFSSSLQIGDLKVYPFRKILKKYSKDININLTTLQYIDSLCLSTFDAIVQMLEQHINLGVYIGYEDLSVYSKKKIIELVKLSPDTDYKLSWEIDHRICEKYKVKEKEIINYINIQKTNAIRNNSLLNNLIPLISSNNSKINKDLCCFNNFARIKCQNNHIYLAKLSSGANITVIYYNNIINSINEGVAIISKGVASSIDNVISMDYLFISINNALKQANLKLNDIDLFEIFDSHPVYTLLIIKEFSIPIERVNLLGNVFIRGDSVAAAGGLLISNAQILFNKYKDVKNILLISYTVSMAITLIVSRA